LLILRDGFAEFGQDGHGNFRCRGGGSRAPIRYEIRNSGIHFMSDAGNDGDPGAEDGASDDFFIERPEILNAAAATPDNHDINTAEFPLPTIQFLNGPGDLGRGALALNRDRI
jgi:hypothetical protein